MLKCITIAFLLCLPFRAAAQDSYEEIKQSYKNASSEASARLYAKELCASSENELKKLNKRNFKTSL